jgi:Lrp/AsnC family transcriptional regulator, leucine-responsive regulatory protein
LSDVLEHFVELDDIDMRILSALQDSGRLSNVDLSSRVGLSPSPCLARVRALEEAGIISRYVALLNPEAVGAGVSVFIQVSLERQSREVLDVFEVRIADMPEVMECYLMSGDADYLLRVVVRDTAHLRDFIVGHLSETPGVSQIRSSFALKQVKYQTALPLRGQPKSAPARPPAKERPRIKPSARLRAVRPADRGGRRKA